jgi:hypothetical protein
MEREAGSERQRNDDSWNQVEFIFIHERLAFAFRHDDDLGALILDVRSHRSRRIKLASKHAIERGRNEWKQVPNTNLALTAEQLASLIGEASAGPHGEGI